MPHISQKSKKVLAIFSLCLCILIFVGGISICSWQIAVQISREKSTLGEITQSQLMNTTCGELKDPSTCYSVNWTYVFQVSDQSYVSEEIDHFDQNYHQAHEFHQKHKVGESITVYYFKDNPTEFGLTKSSLVKYWAPYLVGIIFMVMVALVLIPAGVILYRKYRYQQYNSM